MATYPEIRGPEDSSDFHDSSLIQFAFDSAADRVTAIVSTPDAHGHQKLWQIQMSGVLRIEMESLGDGEPVPSPTPAEVYDIYIDGLSDERKRWQNRLRTLGARGDVIHVVFASSFLRGWGERECLEGIHVLCRSIQVRPGPRELHGREFSRPAIPAAKEKK